MGPNNKENGLELSRRDMLKTMGVAAGGIAAVGLTPAEGAGKQQTIPDEHNVYGAPAGSGISMPPYYMPTPSVKNRNIYLPGTEAIGPDEMRITFMGSQPWPPRLSQAAECIMVEVGNGKRYFFDFGPGCLRNIVANQVPICEVDNIFLTHLHADHIGELPYLWSFSPFAGRLKPIHIIGSSGRMHGLGTKAMWEGMKKFLAWGTRAFQGTGPMPSMTAMI
jgi:ribonuclease Z